VAVECENPILTRHFVGLSTMFIDKGGFRDKLARRLQTEIYELSIKKGERK
jgi:hypothetical protein